MINEEIRDREVRLIDENGEQLGVMLTQRAMELAEERGLDLAKIQPTAKPPVCKLLDYDKYRYEQSRRERENRKNQRVVDIKEVQLSATIEENDVLTKAKQAIKFLEGGDKVKVSIRFRGRQITHSEIGAKVMQDFAERCKEVSVVERRPLMDGRHMIMILAPKAAKASFAEKKAAREAKKSEEKASEVQE
ncbi:MAG: translation initiation factor IF-3 [Clostridia bacterium]|nr:translation initiation factor IF-3 [Clostridia bacterium]